MGLALAIAIYFILWWVTLFAVLPFGVRTQGEEGNVVPGTVSSAPVRVPFMRIILATTIVSAIVFTLGYLFVSSGIVSFDDIPFIPKPVIG